ncbi:hypothetical protein IPC609_13300 [Pseudomonas aeruginosa]|nr:hypothetical protein CWI25_28935 [Pseudomonas aeruginosa]AUA98480.1 hypothetical protein CWI24_29455 [Pseudomonas aeruginosa]AYW62932.1 hypothetical protein EGV93_29690 [Pseudomonas aeruginosa]KAA5632768.1 hypothetical protein F3H11_04010 [Pseudomonas aeruginosa]KAA5640338.1 hypothetical protein F3G63_25940 [Pseudomonas aeruginosa]
MLALWFARHGKSRGRPWPVVQLGAQAPHSVAGAFFASAHSSYGGCAWDTFGCAGCQVPGRPTRVQLPP